MNNMTSSIDAVLPVYIRNRDIDSNVLPIDMCKAVTQVIHSSKLIGVQKINNTWYIYLKDRAARLEFCVKGSIIISGKRVDLHDQNPSMSSRTGAPALKQLDKLTVRHLPLSTSNDQISKFLEQKNITLKSPIRYGLVREVDGQFTTYLSGERYMYVEPFHPPLDKQQKIGDFHCVIIHHGKITSCSACGKQGHKITDEVCEAKPKQPIYSFRGHTHPLSNQYPSQLTVYNKTFKSLEHAYLYRMAMEHGRSDLAELIQNTKHAGEAKRVGKELMDDDKRWEWENNNVSIMKSLLKAKAKQCPEFCKCLTDNKDKVLAEATPSRLWGTGLSPFVTENTSPDFWPGKNLLGALLLEITNEIADDIDDEMNDEMNTNTILDTENNQPHQPPSSQDMDIVNSSNNSNTNEPHISIATSSAPNTRANNTNGKTYHEPENTETQRAARHSRPRQRTPPAARSPRSYSTPSSRNKDSGKNVTKDSDKGASPDIRVVIDRWAKRKLPDSSPDEKVGGHDKLKKGNNDVT